MDIFEKIVQRFTSKNNTDNKALGVLTNKMKVLKVNEMVHVEGGKSSSTFTRLSDMNDPLSSFVYQ